MKTIWLVLALVSGCASTPNSPAAPAPDSPLAGLAQERPSDWWRGLPDASVPVRPNLENWHAFDARGVIDPESQETVWRGVSAVLAGVTYDAAVVALAELEPGPATTLDAYFLVDVVAQREAVLWRWHSASGRTTLHALVSRGQGRPDEIDLWVVVGAQNIAPVHAAWRLGTECVSGAAAGAHAKLAPSGACPVEASLLVGILFDRVSHGGYLEDPDAKTPASVLFNDLPASDRSIDEVFTNSVFPPRFSFP